MKWTLGLVGVVMTVAVAGGQGAAITPAARNAAFRSLQTYLYRTATPCINEGSRVADSYRTYQAGSTRPDMLAATGQRGFADCLAAQHALNGRFGDNLTAAQTAPHLAPPLRSSVSVQRMVWDWQNAVADMTTACLNAQLYAQTGEYGRDVAYRGMATATSTSLADAFSTEWRIEQAWGLVKAS